MQILADRIEFYWTHLAGIGTLENSLWGWDGEEIRVWLNALTIDTSELDGQSALGNVEESLAISVDFYPLCESRLASIVHASRSDTHELLLTNIVASLPGSRSDGQGHHRWRRA